MSPVDPHHSAFPVADPLSAIVDLETKPMVEAGAIALATFLDQVATVLRGGLPQRLWIEATVVSVRASTHGHSLELTDATPARGTPATLRAFLSTTGLAAIRRDLGLAVDPLLLAGMTTVLLVRPDFTPRWHLGGRIEGLSAAVVASLRQKLLQQAVARLKQEGVWDRQRRLAWPRDVTTISVVHPANAAGWADIAGELMRWQAAGLIRVQSCPAPFEGTQATTAIVAALECAVQPIEGHRPDLVLIVRGGGARASLAVLDEEAVARAVAMCPIPVVAGTGHAIDRSLVDQLACRAVDTPSKAVMLVAGIMRDAARGARTDRDAILARAAAQLTEHDRELEARLQHLRALLQQAVTRSASALSDVWAEIRVGAAGAREGLQRWQSELQRTQGDLFGDALRLLDAQKRGLDQELRRGLDHAARHLMCADDGTLVMVQVRTGATALYQRQADALERLFEAVVRDAGRHASEAAATLEQRAAEIEMGDLVTLLQRGLVAVTDTAGRLLSRRAEASGFGRLQLLFADGPLVVVPAQDDEQVSGKRPEPRRDRCSARHLMK